jgi:hypothetical protein
MLGGHRDSYENARRWFQDMHYSDTSVTLNAEVWPIGDGR